MVSIIISEITGWSDYCRRTVIVPVVITALGGILTFLRPEACFLILTGVFVWLGLMAGKQSWSEVKIDCWMIQGKQAPDRIITGKIIATLIITFIHFLILAPIFILTTAIWGIPWGILGEILFGLWLITGLMATLGMMGTLFFGDISEFPRKLFSAAFLFVTCIPGLHFLNPFWQIWRIVGLTASGSTMERLAQFIPNLLLIILSLLVIKFYYRREVTENP